MTTIASKYSPEMVGKMSTLELRFAIKTLSGQETGTRNTTAMRKRVLALIAKVPAEPAPEASRIVAPAVAAPKKAKAKAEPKPRAAKPEKAAKVPPPFKHDHRVLALYKVGEHIEKRDGKGALLARVEVVKEGFAWHGETYSSLSPIAKEVSGTAQSGLVYFGVIPYNDRERKGKETPELAKDFDSALAVFNLVAKGLGLDTIDVAGLVALEASEDHDEVRQAVARLRRYSTLMRAQLAALAVGENLLEVRHGRAPEAVR
jgi:hypothetical protein